MKIKKLLFLSIFIPAAAFGETEKPSFSSNTLIHNPSTEEVGYGNLNFAFKHRFGNVYSSQFFGFEGGASMLISLDYGITDRWSIGLSRASLDRTWEAYSKYNLYNPGIFRISLFGAAGQETSKQVVQLSPRYNIGMSGVPAIDEKINADFNSHTLTNKDKKSYLGAVLVSARLSDRVSLQASPMYTHRNFVKSRLGNSRAGLGLGGRVKIVRWLEFVAEAIIAKKYDYIGENYEDEDRKSYDNLQTLTAEEINQNNYLRPETLPFVYLRNVYFDKPVRYNQTPISIGFDFITAGHTFQIFATNSRNISYTWLLRGADYDYDNGQWTLGFNVNRKFGVISDAKKMQRRLKNQSAAHHTEENLPCPPDTSYADVLSAAVPTCTRCHSGEHPKANFNITKYDEIMKRTGNTPESSFIYQKITVGSMMVNATPEVKNTLACWIKNGRKK